MNGRSCVHHFTSFPLPTHIITNQKYIVILIRQQFVYLCFLFHPQWKSTFHFALYWDFHLYVVKMKEIWGTEYLHATMTSNLRDLVWHNLIIQVKYLREAYQIFLSICQLSHLVLYYPNGNSTNCIRCITNKALEEGKKKISNFIYGGFNAKTPC